MEQTLLHLISLTRLGKAGYKTNPIEASDKYTEASSLPEYMSIHVLDVTMNGFVLTRPIVRLNVVSRLTNLFKRVLEICY